MAFFPHPQQLAAQGYAVLVTDCRGRFASDGEFEPFVGDGDDGYDTVQWAAAQEWCTGAVATIGPSYLGATALLAAREQPPALRCSIAVLTASDYAHGWIYQGGALSLAFAYGWGRLITSGSAASGGLAGTASGGQLAPEDAIERLARRPLTQLPDAPEPHWTRWLEHPPEDAYWEGVRLSASYDRFEVPVFHIGGWFDIFSVGSFRNFMGMRAAGRAPQHLFGFPLAHGGDGRGEARLEFNAGGSGVMRAWDGFLRQHLLGEATALPSVRYFMLGADEWREADDWPPPEGQSHVLYLHSDGHANTAAGDGVLADSPPQAEPPDRYVYDPSDPVPTWGGATMAMPGQAPGPAEQTAIEQRHEVLCYSTSVLSEPVSIAGPVFVELWAVTDALDTDWTSKLVDVHPDGRAISLLDGIIRARYRDSFNAPRAVTPGEPARYIIELSHIAHRFAAGHRIRLEVSSSNFPRFDANPNTGAAIATESVSRPATQHVLHDDEHRSALQLWRLPA
jgi:putative CocE/NonD family hydrolase